MAATRAMNELFLSYYNKNGVSERSIGELCRFLEPGNVKQTYEEKVVKAVNVQVRRYARNSGYKRR